MNQQSTMSIEQALGQAQAHWNAGQVNEAEQLCQQVLQIWPAQSDALHLMGLMAHAYGNLDIAIDHLRRACQAPRVLPIYLSNLAEMCRQKGALADAEESARRAIAGDNTLIAAWNNLGIILQEAGKLEESLSCLERVVALQPDYPEAFNNLGNTLKRLGRLDEARTHYEKALDLAPVYAEAMSNLAFLLNDLGEPDAALDHARRAIDANPRLADAYINAAAVEVSRHRYAEALRWIDSLLSFAPLHVGALGVRATALRNLEQLDEALADARRAIALAPDNGEAQNILGEILQAMNRPVEAIAAYDRAAASLGFAPERALLNRGVVLMETGDAPQAEAIFRQVIAQFPRSASAWFNLSDLHRFTSGDPGIATMEALLGPGGLQARGDRTALHFALGKALLDAGNPERAFLHWDEGNRQKRAAFAYDAAATDRWLDEIAQTFSAEMLGRPRPDVEGSDLPLFVVGMPRSGTTLIEQILASHPAVAAGGELAILSNMIAQINPYPAAAASLTPETEAAFGRHYLDAVRPLAGGRRRLVDKMPSNFLHVGLIARILPQARIIHVRRDPVDTCLSCYSKLFTREQLFTYDQAELGQFYRGYERLMGHWRAVLPSENFLELAYEDVVADLEGQARRMVAFGGLDWDPACLDFHRTPRIIRTASVNQARKPLFSTSVGRWRPYAAYLGPLLAALGIDPDAFTEPPAAKTRPARKTGPVAG